ERRERERERERERRQLRREREREREIPCNDRSDEVERCGFGCRDGRRHGGEDNGQRDIRAPGTEFGLRGLKSPRLSYEGEATDKSDIVHFQPCRSRLTSSQRPEIPQRRCLGWA